MVLFICALIKASQRMFLTVLCTNCQFPGWLKVYFSFILRFSVYVSFHILHCIIQLFQWNIFERHQSSPIVSYFKADWRYICWTRIDHELSKTPQFYIYCVKSIMSYHILQLVPFDPLENSFKLCLNKILSLLKYENSSLTASKLKAHQGYVSYVASTETLSS